MFAPTAALRPTMWTVVEFRAFRPSAVNPPVTARRGVFVSLARGPTTLVVAVLRADRREAVGDEAQSVVGRLFSVEPLADPDRAVPDTDVAARLE